jgi:hypothetical protein
MEADADAVEFAHDPAAGVRSWERLHVAEGLEALAARLAEIEGRSARAAGAGGELRHLLELATPPDAAVESAAAAAPASSDPADRLAAWLLARTDLAGL